MARNRCQHKNKVPLGSAPRLGGHYWWEWCEDCGATRLRPFTDTDFMYRKKPNLFYWRSPWVVRHGHEALAKALRVIADITPKR